MRNAGLIRCSLAAVARAGRQRCGRRPAGARASHQGRRPGRGSRPRAPQDRSQRGRSRTARRRCTGRCAKTISSSRTVCCAPAPIRAPRNRYGVTPLQPRCDQRQRRHHRAAARGGRRRERSEQGRRNGADDGSARRTASTRRRCCSTRGATVDAREPWHGQTALMWAAAQGHPAMIRELVARGADVNARSNVEEWERQETAEPRDKWLPPGGMTPLLFAAREGCVDCIGTLVALGARRQHDHARRHQPGGARVDQRPLRRRGRAGASRNGSEPRRLHRARRLVCGDRLQHDAELEPPGAEGSRELVDGARRRADAARARRRSERAARALAAVSRQARSRQRHDARRRHHTVPARREGGGSASDAATASTRRRSNDRHDSGRQRSVHTRRNQPA